MRTPWIKNNLPLFDASIEASSENNYDVFRSDKDGIEQYKGNNRLFWKCILFTCIYILFMCFRYKL